MKIEIIYHNSTIEELRNKYNTRKNIKILKKIAGLTIGLCLTMGYTSVLATPNIEETIATADRMGRMVWKILLAIGYWAAAIYGTKDMIADFGSSDLKGLVKTGIKYLVGFAIIFFFIDFLDLIRSFKN